MRRQIENAGFEVIEADDSVDVSSLLEREVIDVVVSDVVMGSRGGLHVAKDVRASGRDIPIIFVTGALSVESGPLRDTARELGVRHIISKPYDTQTLLDAISAALGSG
jgi:two-component system response regulator MprA